MRTAGWFYLDTFLDVHVHGKTCYSGITEGGFGHGDIVKYSEREDREMI